MHEFTIATSIVEAVLDLANKHGSSKVLEVHLRIGKLRALSTEQVSFSYGVLAKGTILEGSRMTVEESTGSARCPNCNYHGELDPDGDLFHFGLPPLICPQCGGHLSIEGGDECIISRVRMVLPAETQEGEVASEFGE